MDKTSSVSLLFIILIFFSNSCSTPGDEHVINDQLESVLISPEIVLEIKETEDHLFGRLSSLDVDSEGRVYVTDSQMMNIKIFDREGSSLHTIGRKGSGPGEFQSPGSISVDDSNTVWIYDNSKLGISSFPMLRDTTWEFQSQITIPDATEGYPMTVYKFNEGFVVAYMKTLHEETRQKMEITLSSLNYDGEMINEEILTYVEEEVIVPDSEGEFIPIYPIPFNWRTKARIGKTGEIYLGKSDSLRLRQYDLTGRIIEEIKNRVRYRPVTAADIEEYGAKPDAPFYNHIPNHHPAFLDFHVDDEERYWFNLGELKEDKYTWVVLNADGTLTLSVELPSRLDVQKIRSDRLYGIHRSENGHERVLGYDIRNGDLSPP